MVDDRVMCKNALQGLSQVFIESYGVWEGNSFLLVNFHGGFVRKVLCSRQVSPIPECTTPNPPHGHVFRHLALEPCLYRESGQMEQGEESNSDENEYQRPGTKPSENIQASLHKEQNTLLPHKILPSSQLHHLGEP